MSKTETNATHNWRDCGCDECRIEFAEYWFERGQ